jgi:hypothetical protein
MPKRKKPIPRPTPITIAHAVPLLLNALKNGGAQHLAPSVLSKAQAGVRPVVRPSHLGWVGNHNGRRFGSIQFESLPEHDFLNRAEIEPEFTAVIRQPFVLAWTDTNGRQREHIPDFGALRFGKPAIIEIKTKAEANQSDVLARTAFMQAAFGSHGIGYDVITEDWYRAEPAHDNARLLALGRPYEPTFSDAADVKEYLDKVGPQDAWTIAEALQRDPQFSYAVYALCIDGHLKLANPTISIRDCGRFTTA